MISSHPQSKTTKLASSNQKAFLTYRPKNRPDIEIGLYLLKMEDLEIAAHLLADRFSNTEAKYVHLGIPYEDVYRMMLVLVKRSIEDGLAVCAIDLTENKLVCIDTLMDTYREIKEPLNFEKLFPKDAQIHKLFEFWEQFNLPKEMEPKRLGEFWGGGMAATDLEYERFGIITRMTAFHMHLMPVGQATTLAGNNRSQNSSSSGGAKIMKAVRLRDYKDKNGVKIFEGIDETCKRIKVEPFEYVSLMYWDSRQGPIVPTQAAPKL